LQSPELGTKIHANVQENIHLFTQREVDGVQQYIAEEDLWV